MAAEDLPVWEQGHDAGYRLGVAVSYDLGYRDALEAVAENVLELEALGPDWRTAVAKSPEQRYRDRLAAMRTANGPAAHLDACRARQRRCDELAIQRAASVAPFTTWAEIRATVSPAVWDRIQRERAEVVA